MELQLSGDQELFLDTSRRLLAAECSIAAVRSLEAEPDGFSRDTWRRGAELGWTSMLVPEAHGGGSLSEHGLLDLALVAEEMGRTVAPGPLVPVNLVAAALGAAGTEAQRAQVLPGLLAGEAVAAWTGPQAIDAEVQGDDLVLRGTMPAVEAGGQADHLLVVVRSGEGLSHVLVPAATEGLVVGPMGTLDLVRRFASVTFDGAVVPRALLVGELGGAAGEVERLLQIACALQCAETCGAIDRVLAMTIEYLGDRYSFGRPLSSYQALKHRIADQKVWLEACHAITTAATRAVAAGESDAGRLASAAKHWVGPHATELIQDCIQLHGGIGITWEHDLHLYLRRATVNRTTYGTPDDHADRIADEILGVAS